MTVTCVLISPFSAAARALCVAVMIAAMAACATNPQVDGGSGPDEGAVSTPVDKLSASANSDLNLLPPGSGTTLPDGSIRHDVNSPRIAQLWAAAERAQSDDDLESADRYIDEALAIAPQDGVLWSRAADLKMSLLELSLAENYATKSNAYAGDNRTLQHRNWLIIQHVRELRGDLLGVRDARKMVQQLQY